MRWTGIEDEHLMRLVNDRSNVMIGKYNWKKISSIMVNRSARQCRERWAHCINTELDKTVKWKPEDDETITRLQSLHGNKWTLIGAEISPTRSSEAVRRRWYSISKNLWTKHEEEQLIKLVGDKLFDTKSDMRAWQTSFSTQMKYKTANQCIDHWFRHFRPVPKIQEWLAEDDKKVIKLHSLYGNSWKRITTHFPHRSKHSIRLRLQYLIPESTKNNYATQDATQVYQNVSENDDAPMVSSVHKLIVNKKGNTHYSCSKLTTKCTKDARYTSAKARVTLDKGEVDEVENPSKMRKGIKDRSKHSHFPFVATVDRVEYQQVYAVNCNITTKISAAKMPPLAGDSKNITPKIKVEEPCGDEFVSFANAVAFASAFIKSEEK